MFFVVISCPNPMIRDRLILDNQIDEPAGINLQIITVIFRKSFNSVKPISIYIEHDSIACMC
jgi:hypothetical protein